MPRRAPRRGHFPHPVRGAIHPVPLRGRRPRFQTLRAVLERSQSRRRVSRRASLRPSRVRFARQDVGSTGDDPAVARAAGTAPQAGRASGPNPRGPCSAGELPLDRSPPGRPHVPHWGGEARRQDSVLRRGGTGTSRLCAASRSEPRTVPSRSPHEGRAHAFARRSCRLQAGSRRPAAAPHSPVRRAIRELREFRSASRAHRR